MSILKTTGTISRICDLTPTAKEVTLTLDTPITFIAGHFVNVFIDIEGKHVRRAYSVSSSDEIHNTITLSIRLNPKGLVTPLFWERDLTGTSVSLMGPLGLNTADKMHHERIFLCAFGIGAGVVKSLAEYFVQDPHITELTILTGSRTVDDIIYKDYFDMLAHKHPGKIKVSYTVSDLDPSHTEYSKGYIQDHIAQYDFNHADVYVCGQEVACDGLVATVRSFTPIDCDFFIEGFH